MRPRTFFFCCGLPKSGTTFLQRLLDSHPEVSCPSEHQFDALQQGLASLFQHYNERLRRVDLRTGGQGATEVDGEAQWRIFRAAVDIVIERAAGNKPIAGANDNGILNRLEWYGRSFGSRRTIAIFRNPVDAGLSAWHHNYRIAESENAPGHVQAMLRFGGLDGWLVQCARYFRQAVNDFTGYSRQYGASLLLRYEDLATDTVQRIGRVFEFLGADADPVLLRRIAAENTLDAMRVSAKDPAFFRTASIAFGGDAVGPEVRRAIQDAGGEALGLLGYDIVGSMLGEVCAGQPWVQG